MKVIAIKNFRARRGLQVKFESNIIRGPMMNNDVVVIPFDIVAGEVMEAINPVMIPANCYEEVIVKAPSRKKKAEEG